MISSDDKQRTRHVDCNVIVRNNKTVLFKASEEYGQPLIHSTSGITLTQFEFNETGKYRVSVVIGELNFFSINPVAIDFTATVADTSDGGSRVVLST